MFDPKIFLSELSAVIRNAVFSIGGTIKGRKVHGNSVNGDPQFGLDEVAEAAAIDFLRASGLHLALYAEEKGLEFIGGGSGSDGGRSPEFLLILDPIDGTRPAAAGLEMATISAALAPYSADATLADVQWAALREFKSGNLLFAAKDDPVVKADTLSNKRETRGMFWSFELSGHPTQWVSRCLGNLLDTTACAGGVFVFNSCSYSLSRIALGQMDAYVDIGNRLLRDYPESEKDFRRVGLGSILHLFPYDLAAALMIAKKSGVIVTDAYGQDLGETLLLSGDPLNQRSCIAACTQELHQEIMKNIVW
ncbi:MAG: hypothetical protein HQK53_04985 [Oligoflexia bacterium]|nr:hypothetical protein [Oligoflexia bacterium]